MIKKTFILIILISLVGCTLQNDKPMGKSDMKTEISKLNEEKDDLNIEISKLKEEVEGIKGENLDLTDQNTFLKNKLKSPEYDKLFNFKETIKMKVEILEKGEWDEIYPYYAIVTKEDKDHNTPLFITIADEDAYKSLKLNETYELKVYVATVIDLEQNEVRFEYALQP